MFPSMARHIKQPLAFVFMTLFAVGLGMTAAAQDSIAAEDPVTDATADALSVVERWQTDPNTIFDASEINLADLAFIARPVVVFADSPNDPRFAEQMALLAAQADALSVRNVILVADTNPALRSDLRQMLRPHGFALVLMDTDGRVALRKPEPWDVRELTRVIDKMPSRLQELGR